MLDDTIAAISTSLGAGGVSVVRLSGNKAVDIANRVFKTPSLDNLQKATANMMYLGKFNAPDFTERCFFVYFKAPKSYTGEDVVEFQCHGGVKLTEKILQILLDNGAVMADKGEFTKRAFINGKLSLSDAENMIDMITAESDVALTSASRLLYGKFRSEVEDIFSSLTDLIAEGEASLDYPEETEGLIVQLSEKLDTIKTKLSAMISSAKTAKVVKQGISVAIIGIPNVGKSSLLNALLKKERAIVSDIAGTTRDVVGESIDYEGFKINFLDTAGIRSSSNPIENIGTIKAKEQANLADIVLFVTEANRDFTDEEKKLYDEIQCKKVIVKNKSDLIKDKINCKNDEIYVSTKLNYNIKSVFEKILSFYKKGVADCGGEVITSMRHLDLLKSAMKSIESALCDLCAPLECLLVDLKSAWLSVGKIIGTTADEEIIDAVFSKFCLGK